MKDSDAKEEAVHMEISPHGVATLTLDRPPVNSVHPDLIYGLLEAVDLVATNDEVRSVLIKGAGGKFSAGADIEVMSDESRANYRVMRRWVEAGNALERLEKPVICGIERFALGGGAELALACDVRIIGEGAVFGFPEVSLGLFPGAGGTQRLTRLVGANKAFWLMATGAKLCAQDALSYGLVNEVVGDGEVLTRANEIAEMFAGGATRAIGIIKRLVYEWSGPQLASGLVREADAVFEVVATDDYREGFSAFQEKRPPHFTGR